MKKFDFYEFAGILCPGAVVILGLSRFYPTLSSVLFKDKISFGELGLLLIVSYVAGHLLQAVGNVVEKVWWFAWGGMPSDWVRSGNHSLLAAKQNEALPHKIPELTGIHFREGIDKLGKEDWYSITRQVYAVVRQAARSERIDIFNANYGMFRGIAAAMLVLIIVSVVESGWNHECRYIFAGAALVLALLRMHRFAVNYARELFVQFLSTNKNDKPTAAAQQAE